MRPDKRSGPVTTPGRPNVESPPTATDRAMVQRTRRVPWTCDPALRWEVGQAGACLAAIGILRELLSGELHPAYWRARVQHALEALDAAVSE
jgi:hypothetical protein